MVSIKRLSAILLVILLLRSQAFGAFGAGTEWDVRTTGSDANGGGFDPLVASPGTDYSQQDAAEFAYTDIIIGATTTQATSLARPFSSVDPGNVVNVTAGAGCTVQRAEILSVAAGVATFDKSLGTAASTCTGALGGSLLTVATGLSASGGNTVSTTVPAIIHIKAGTYTLTASVAVPGAVNVRTVIWGFNSTHRDGGTRPLITTATNSTDLFQVSGGQAQKFVNLSLSNTASTRAIGLAGTGVGVYPDIIVHDSVLDGFSYHIKADNAGGNVAGLVSLYNTEFKNATTGGVRFWFEGTAEGCYFHDNTGDALVDTSSQNYFMFVRNNVFDSNGRGAVFPTDEFFIEIVGNTFYNQTTDAVYSPGTTTTIWISNNIFYGNGGKGLNFNSVIPVFNALVNNRNNAYGSNAGGDYDAAFPAGIHDVTLSADPFTNGAAGDFTLNNTAGGGAALKGAAFASGFGTTTSNSLDIGAVQSPVPSCPQRVCGAAH